MTKQTDIIKCRIEFLKQFDDYVKNVIRDEELTEDWLMMGLPDGYSEADLKERATDEELWISCVEAFAHCCMVAGIIN